MGSPLQVRDVMSKDVATVDSHESVGAAREKRSAAGVHYLAVHDEGELIGVVCACDLSNEFFDHAVQSACGRSPVFVSGESSLQHAAEVMTNCGVGSLLVLDDGVLVGIITSADLVAQNIWQRDAWSCASCGAHHHLSGSESARFCADCLEQTRSDGYRQYYFTLGGGD